MWGEPPLQRRERHTRLGMLPRHLGVGVGGLPVLAHGPLLSLLQLPLQLPDLPLERRDGRVALLQARLVLLQQLVGLARRQALLRCGLLRVLLLLLHRCRLHPVSYTHLTLPTTPYV